MKIAAIDRDYITHELDTSTRVGLNWQEDGLSEALEDVNLSELPEVRFRCKDDDGEIYYGGWLLNDEEGEVQYIVLMWAQHDAGCTTIEVNLDGEWVQEIG